MDSEARDLLTDLLAWRSGQDLRPLRSRAIELVGPTVEIHLSTDPQQAREKLIDAVEDFLERGP